MAYTRVRLYTPIGTNQKFGGLCKIWGGGAVPPGPSLKPPLNSSLDQPLASNILQQYFAILKAIK